MMIIKLETALYNFIQILAVRGQTARQIRATSLCNELNNKNYRAQQKISTRLAMLLLSHNFAAQMLLS